MCNYLTVRCYLEAKELNEALQIVNLVDVETFTNTASPHVSAAENESFDETPKCVSKIMLICILFYILFLFNFAANESSSVSFKR